MKNKTKILITAAICLCVVVTAVVNSSHGVLLGGIIGHYGLSDSQQGYANSAQNIGDIIAMLTSLLLVGRIRKQSLLVISAAAISAVMIPIGFMPSFSSFTLLFVAVGIAFGYMDTLTSSIMADLYPGENSAKMMCLLHACHGFAGILAPMLLTVCMQRYGTGVSYFCIAAFGGLLLLYIAPVLLFSKDGQNSAVQQTAPVTVSTLKTFFKNPVLVVVLLCILLYGFHLQGMICWVVRHMETGLHSTLSVYVLSALYLGLTGSRLLVPLLRLQAVTYIRWSGIGAGVVLTIGLLSGSAAVMLVCVALCSLCSGAMIPVIFSFACANFPQNTLLATTVSFIFMLLGNSVSTPLIGAAEGAAGINTAMLLCAGSITLCGCATFLLRQPKKGISLNN